VNEKADGVAPVDFYAQIRFFTISHSPFSCIWLITKLHVISI
jgi:hypothetical protein